MNDSGDEDELISEDIDYTDANFILKNLKSAIPTYDSDKTMTLQGRQELANTVSLQVLFYSYLAFQGFLMRMNTPPSILVFGDGKFSVPGFTIVVHNIYFLIQDS